jgi:hypothetical protein
MKNRFLVMAIGLAQLFFFAPVSAHEKDEHQIAAVMKQLFEKPGAPLTVAPVSVEGNYAVAGWSQGGRGGRAFLQKEKDQWAITVCGGSGLTQASEMQLIGMKADAAARLASHAPHAGHGESAKK